MRRGIARVLVAGLVLGSLVGPRGAQAQDRKRTRARPGPKLTLQVKEIPVVELLGFLADFARLSLVAGDEVAGKVTVDLKNVHWHRAFEVVARSRDLWWELEGNVLLVTTREAHRREMERQLEAQEARKALTPRKLRLLPVSFARASELVPQMKSILGEEARVSVDERTNTLIVFSP